MELEERKTMLRANKIRLCIRNVFTGVRLMNKNTSDSEESQLIQRVNQHVNYVRRFISPEKVEVIVPTLPYQAFDTFSTGTRIKPWYLLDLIVSIRLFTQHPAKHSGNPNDSLVDTHILQRHHLIFAVGFKMSIDQSFHSQDNPKFPLKVLAEFTHAGNSSGRRVYTVSHPTNEKCPYIVCEMDEVLVSKETRRPAMYPDWWTSKYNHLKKEKNKLSMQLKEADSILKMCDVRVDFEHMDHNSHTTISAYLKYCVNVAFRIAKENKSDAFTLEHFGAGVQNIQMQFHNESGYGDMLTVKSWHSNNTPGQLYFEIFKHVMNQTDTTEVLCCSAFLHFFQPYSSLKGKL